MPYILDIPALATKSDDTLADEFIYWFRVYRNEGRLPDNERAYFKAIAAEQEKRKLDARTPLMQNWRELKDSLPPDALLLFRLGDFYESFYEDAALLAHACNIALTKRNMVAMSGIPAHGLYVYLPMLTKAGLRVAVAEPEDLTPMLSPNFKARPEYQARQIVATHPRFPIPRE